MVTSSFGRESGGAVAAGTAAAGLNKNYKIIINDDVVCGIDGSSFFFYDTI